MNGTSGLQEVRSSPPDHQRIGSCTSDGINSAKVPGTIFMHGGAVERSLNRMATNLSPRSHMGNEFRNKDRSVIISRGCLSVSLILMTALSFSACVRVAVIAESTSYEQPQSEPPSTPSISFASGSSAPFCQLNPSVATVEQENSAWCWATSTTLVINHLDPLRPLKQCEAVHITLKPEREDYEAENPNYSVDCCLVTDDKMREFNNPDRISQPRDKDVPPSVSVCHRTGRPERALSALGYDGRFQIVQWNPYSPSPQGLTWEELTGQVCSNRPFISVKLWDEGGTHAEVVTGYHFDPDAMVDLDSIGMDGFHTIPYDDYLGKPGDYVHVRDYYDIGL